MGLQLQEFLPIGNREIAERGAALIVGDARERPAREASDESRGAKRSANRSRPVTGRPIVEAVEELEVLQGPVACYRLRALEAVGDDSRPRLEVYPSAFAARRPRDRSDPSASRA